MEDAPVRPGVVPFFIAMVCASAMGDLGSLAISSSITDTGSSQAKPSCAILAPRIPIGMRTRSTSTGARRVRATRAVVTRAEGMISADRMASV